MSPFDEVAVRLHLETCREAVCEHEGFEIPHPAPAGLWTMCPVCDTECQGNCRCCLRCEAKGCNGVGFCLDAITHDEGFWHHRSAKERADCHACNIKVKE